MKPNETDLIYAVGCGRCGADGPGDGSGTAAVAAGWVDYGHAPDWPAWCCLACKVDRDAIDPCDDPEVIEASDLHLPLNVTDFTLRCAACGCQAGVHRYLNAMCPPTSGFGKPIDEINHRAHWQQHTFFVKASP